MADDDLLQGNEGPLDPTPLPPKVPDSAKDTWGPAWEALKKAIPELELAYPMDYGHTWCCRNPTTQRVVYLKEVLRPERDQGYVGYRYLTLEGVPAMITFLLRPQPEFKPHG